VNGKKKNRFLKGKPGVVERLSNMGAHRLDLAFAAMLSHSCRDYRSIHYWAYPAFVNAA